MNNSFIHIESLINKISDYAKKKKLVLSLERIVFILISSLLIFIFFTAIESWAYFTPIIKTIFIVLMFSLFTIFICYELIKSFLFRKKCKNQDIIEAFANEIGNKIPTVKDKLLNSVQIISDSKNRDNKLAIAAFDSIYTEIADYEFEELINKKILKSRIKVFLSLFILSVLLFSLTPLHESFIRILNYNREFIKPYEFSLKIVNGNQKVKKGNPASIIIKGEGKIPNEIYLFTKSNDEVDYTNHILKKDTAGFYKKNYRALNSSVKYYAESGDVKTEVNELKIISPPIITDLNFEISPPSYSQIPKYIQNEDGNITALKGSRVNLNLTASKNLSKAFLVIGKNVDTLELKGNNASGSFILSENSKYHFRIKDLEKLNNESPIEYSLQIIEDQYPELKINRPEQNSLIPNTDIVSIDYEIKDDFGFSNVILKYYIKNSQGSIKDKSENIINLRFSKSELNQSLYYNWDLSKLLLRENDLVQYYLEVFDNDIISGPKSVKSPLFQLRVPTLDELFAQSDELQNNAIEELTNTLKEAENLSEEFSNISDNLKKNEKEISYNEKEQIENAVEKFNNLTEKIDSIKQSLQEMSKKMMENNLLSEETLEKYNELQNLMDEIGSDDLKNALKEMQKSLENLMRNDIQKSLDNLSVDEKMFQKSIERTLNLLKRIQIEQKVDEIIKRTEKITEDLKNIEEKVNQSNENDFTKRNELLDEQNQMTEQLSDLQDEMNKLSEKMKDVQNVPADEMEKIKEGYESQQNEKLSESAQENFEINEFQKAMQMNQQITQNVESTQKQMQNMQNQMQQQSKQMVMQQMLKSIDNILNLSTQQENLKIKTEKLSSKPSQLQNLTQEQFDLQQGLDNVLKQLNELSQNTFAITPEMGELLGNARKNMYEALANMHNKNGQRSSAQQGEALGNLNNAALILQNSLQAMMQGGGQGGGGMMSLMQQLQQMAQQQMGINQLTQSLKGNLSLQQQAQMQRIAQQQSALQRSLQELNREAKLTGQSKKLSSNLEKILNEMKEVVSGINTKQIDDQLIKKQENILSKLLDTQISLNERDFEKNRESKTAEEIVTDSPTELILNQLSKDNLLREELLKSIKENYSTDYKKLILEYYKLLEQKLNATDQNNN